MITLNFRHLLIFAVVAVVLGLVAGCSGVTDRETLNFAIETCKNNGGLKSLQYARPANSVPLLIECHE